MTTSRAAGIGALLALLTATGPGAQSPPAYHTIIRNGTIVDGSGLLPYKGDVALRGDYIAKIGNLSKDKADYAIDATGLYVTPGFINIHSHASPAALARAENMLTQGVTTEIVNADGGGPVDLAAQATRLASGLAVNVGGFIGFNSVWSNVVGPDNRRPTVDEIERMRGLIVEGMKGGAWGVSAGLDYKPAYFSTTDEVIRVVSAVAPFRTIFTNHDRITPETKFSSRAGIAETLTIAERSGLIGIVTHMKATGRERGTATASLKLIADSTRRGHYAAADVYPYLAGMTGLGALLLPAWALDGGRPALRSRLADPEQRAKIVAETEQIMQDRFGGEGVYLPGVKRELSDVMREMNVSAGEAIARLMEQQGNQPMAIIRFGLEEDVRAILQYPDASIACDCGATTSTTTHPRNYGTYPRVLGRYVREQKALTWHDAVRKMTALPAATIGMVDRGYLAPGMKADVTVFDPATVIDRATYEDPAVLSEGIRHVFVNGAHALRDGAVTGEQGGRLLRRGAGGIDEPSRPMPAGRRALSVRATDDDISVTVDIAQGPKERRARGTFRVVDRKSGKPWPSSDLGVLQVGNDWASFTTSEAIVVISTDAKQGAARVMMIATGDGKGYHLTTAPRNVRITGAGTATRGASRRSGQ